MFFFLEIGLLFILIIIIHSFVIHITAVCPVICDLLLRILPKIFVADAFFILQLNFLDSPSGMDGETSPKYYEVTDYEVNDSFDR